MSFDNFDIPFGEPETVEAQVVQQPQVQAQAVQQPQVQAQPVQQAQAVATVQTQAVALEDEIDFGDIQIAGAQIGDIGIKVSRFAFEKCKFVKTSKARISLVSTKVAVIKMHYREGLGNYICFNGDCCKNDGYSRIRYLFPVCRYETDTKGKPVSRNVTQEVLVLGKDAYETIVTMSETCQGKLSDYDLVVTCTDEQFQKITFVPAGQALWKRDAEVKKEVIDFWKANLKDLIKPVANVLTAQEYANAIAENEADVAEPPAQADVNFDSVFG